MIRPVFLCLIFVLGCSSESVNNSKRVLTGADQMEDYLPLLRGKKVGLTVNHSSLISNTHLTDTLLASGIDIVKVFTPEHGFKGIVSDGTKIEYDTIEASSYSLISLYGKNKKPEKEQMRGVEIMVFDIQDVGVRFYTYISTMYYMMEACAENDIPFLILDRPNPNGSYVDGPVLDMTFSSFVGIVPIPIVHGMTIGELAQMFNNEGWLKDEVKCELSVVTMKNWKRAMPYSLPVKPSPNLPNDLSVSLYPSLALFEGTIMSVGRGTDYAFQQIGHPDYPENQHSFTPVSREGAKSPPYQSLVCYGRFWSDQKIKYIFTLQPLIEAYHKMDHDDFFNDYFKRLAGNDQLQKKIEAGMEEAEIKKTWETDLNRFKQIRIKYLLYK